VLAGLGAAALPGLARAAPGVPKTLAERTGSLFLPGPARLTTPPEIERIALPSLEHPRAIWGATGRDPAGRIWFGVSTETASASARLLSWDPRTRTWRQEGDVASQLRRVGRLRAGETQLKIHSRIVPGDDGLLYFASMDEHGERADGSALPRWGGHLWRLRPGEDRWQHLLSTPEALIAVAGAGRWIYALGYWNHVLHQFDTHTGATQRVVVGSVGGHVSRNLLADLRGHAWVPRLARTAGGVAASLVEFDPQLREVGSTPLEHYVGPGATDDQHGITGIAALPGGRLAFTTGRGQLYLVEPVAGGPSRVTALGWFHPDGEAYAPSLFAYGGDHLLAGVTLRRNRFEWVVHELITRTAFAMPLALHGLRNVLLYGSQARDDDGGCYLVGWAGDAAGSQRPLVLRVLQPIGATTR